MNSPVQTGVEIASVICMLAVGVSHVLRPQVWIDFFTRLRNAGEAGIFAVAFIHLPLALLIVALHPRWSGIPAVLTFLGWGWLLKATIYFTFPRVGMFGLARVSPARAHEFVVGGFVMIALACLIAYPLVVRG